MDYFERISVDPDKLVSALHGLGEANLQLKEFDRAGEALGRAWKIASEKDIPIRDKGMLLISIGDLLIARHNPKAALAAFHQAQTCFADSFTNPSLISMPEMAQLSADPWNLVALERKAVAFEAIYPSDSNSSWLAQALRCYYLGFEVVDHARQSFTTLQSHDFLARFSREIYERAIALSLKADGKISRLDGVALAFQFAEKSKARTLLSKMEEQFLPEEGGIPDSILWAGAILEENVRQLELLSGDQPGYWGQLREARYKLETFRGTWEENFPAYFENRGKLPFTGLPDLRQSLLGGGKLLIEYFWGDSSIYAFGLTEREMKIVSIPNSILLNLDLDFLRKFFSNLPEANIHAEKTEFYEKGSRIWNTLVEPFLSFSPQTQSLVIIPDDKLWNIPFGALPESIINSGSPPSWREIPFSIRKYSFQYGVSALFLQKSKKMVTPFSKEGVLWISPEFEEGRRISLPKNELEEIQRIFPQSQFLCGTFVSRDTIAKLIPAWQIPVFFTHGEASNLQPGNSCISLNSARDPGREECLYAYEIGTFRLNSELVVLCACQSGLGKSLPGEGLISLGHEFLNAGCPAVVTTLWKVNATKSARIITEFFRGLQEGKAKSNALQEAKITYIENAPEIQLHPFFWAGLVLVGNDAAISMGNW
ncbi:MAG: CHAT domain-containing protein [Bacteroidia bacterium]|nr:CHAT domain-containing protein [Bacteroidia bacterium]